MSEVRTEFDEHDRFTVGVDVEGSPWLAGVTSSIQRLSGRDSFLSPEAFSMSWTQERARVASLSRSRRPDDPDLLEARRALRAARLEDHVAKVLDEAPPLTPEQRSRIASLLQVVAA